MKNKRHFSTKWTWLTVLVVLVLLVVIFFAAGGVNKTKRLYYGYKVRSAFGTENKKLEEPLKALGFTDIKGGKSLCQYIEKANYQGKPLDCTDQQQSYRVFGDDAAKNKAIIAAGKLSALLKTNGWRQGNYEVDKWFKDVVADKVDYNADAYYYKYYGGNTFCALDFFVAYANPEPPAVSATFSCTVPETHPPIY